MKKIAISFSALFFLSTASFAQTNKEGIDRRMKDPKTAEQAGKADVYILKKNTIDSLDEKSAATNENKKGRKASRKKKS